MSNAHVAWAFEQKGLTPTRKFVLVALADRCNKDTLRCDPSIKRLSEDTCLNERTVERALNDLEESGLIERVHRQRQNGSTTSSEFLFPGVTVTPTPRHSATPPPGSVPPPEPEVRTGTEPLLAEGVQKGRPRNDIWDALETMFGPAATRTEQTARGKVVASLKAAGATPEEMFARAKRWPRHFDGATLTQHALEKHWSTLDPARKPLRRR